MKWDNESKKVTIEIIPEGQEIQEIEEVEDLTGMISINI